MSKRKAVAETLRQRVISAQHFGTLPPDGRLPSARRISAELGIDQRVVVAAYRLLESEGLVQARPPSRAFFAGITPRVSHAGGGSDWLVDVLSEALSRDVAVPAFPEFARRAVETLRLRAACIECNTDQLVWLTRELGDDYGLVTDGVEAAELSSAQLPALVRSADLLVTTPSHAPEVRAVAVALGKPFVVVTQRPDLVDELARLLDEGPVYFIGTDPRFAGKLRQLFASWRKPEHVRPVILGRDDVNDVPDGSPAYVMRTARMALGGVPQNVRALSTLRVFSPECRRELLSFIVRANSAGAAARGS